MPRNDLTRTTARDYTQLATYRRISRWDGYRQPEDYGYDFRQFVSPYTKTAGNHDADVMLILQDWASHDGLTARGVDPDIQRLGHDPTITTNKRLKSLLQRHLGLRLEDTYGTNAFVFIKPGGMSGNIPMADVRRSVAEFTLREVELVRPRVILALGARVHAALTSEGIEAQALPHPAARISNAAMDEAWQRLPAAD